MQERCHYHRQERGHRQLAASAVVVASMVGAPVAVVKAAVGKATEETVMVKAVVATGDRAASLEATQAEAASRKTDATTQGAHHSRSRSRCS